MRATNLALGLARSALLFTMAEAPACVTACGVLTTTGCLTFAVADLEVGTILNSCSTVVTLFLANVTAR